MTEHETNMAVRQWLNGLPGTVEANTGPEVLRKAWGMFGSGGVEMFRQALARNGFAPEQVGPKFILRLPSRPIAGANAERQRRLHNIAG